MLVISDGQANAGIYDRDELAQLAADEAARGVSISTVGVGLDFDEHTMRRLAEVGRGNYYFVEDTVALSAMFVHELGNLSQIVASDVRLIVAPEPGVRIEEAYGYPMTRAGDRVVVPVADLRAGEARKVVFRVSLNAAVGAPFVATQVDVGWRRVSDGVQGGARAVSEVDVVADPAAVAASVDPATIQAVEQALSARALEEAAAAYDRDGASGAQQVLERRATAVRASARYLPPATVQALEAASTGAIEGFAKAPAQAKKAASVKAYELAR
jgi:Ca-activated chloride channel family protein